MNRLQRTIWILSALGVFAAAPIRPAPAVVDAELPHGPAGACLGGLGGVHLLPEPGLLEIDVFKQDQNRGGRTTELRAILLGPDRRVLAEASIPDDGLSSRRGAAAAPGPVRRTRLSARVTRRGVHVLNVTVSNDRYGERMFWGFATNCPRYVIETARGHRDARHEEPIVLSGLRAPIDLWFAPRRGAMTIDLAGINPPDATLELADAAGGVLGRVAVDGAGNATWRIPAAAPRDGGAPWRFRLPIRGGTIHIDGVTRWNNPDRKPDQCCWTLERDAYFSVADHRRLLTPYSHTVYAQPGEPVECELRLHNGTPQQRTIDLAIEFPGEPWPADLSTRRIELGAGRDASVTVRCAAPAAGPARICHVRATPADGDGYTTYSTIEVRRGTAPAQRALSLPIMLEPYRHENELFGYRPDYPTANEVYVDARGRAFIRTSAALARLIDGAWQMSTPRSVVDGTPLPGSGGPSKVAFDRRGGVYLLAGAGRGAAVLLHSTDGGATFAACAVPGRGPHGSAYDLEQFTGHNMGDGPPAIVRFTRTGSDPKLFWRHIHDLELLVPELRDGRLTLREPIVLSRKCIGLAAHSGIPSTVVSRAGKIHVIWGETTEPDEKVPGVPTFVATCDRATGQVGRPALIGYGAPPNDVHNTPSITIDSRGHLHALAGTHGAPFQYARSLAPDDAGGGWTEAAPLGAGLSQTYIGFVCGPDDTLHVAYRLWRRGEAPHPAAHHATLAWQRKRPGQAWDAPRILVEPPFSEYSVYYHRLTIAPDGRMFLSYDHWSTHWFYRNDRPERRRALLTSADGGDTWRLAMSADLAGRARPQRPERAAVAPEKTH